MSIKWLLLVSAFSFQAYGIEVGSGIEVTRDKNGKLITVDQKSASKNQNVVSVYTSGVDTVSEKNIVNDDQYFTFKKDDGTYGTYPKNKSQKPGVFEDPDGDGYVGISSKNMIKSEDFIMYKKANGVVAVYYKGAPQKPGVFDDPDGDGYIGISEKNVVKGKDHVMFVDKNGDIAVLDKSVKAKTPSELKECTVSVGQSIDCPEGTYKFIGNNSLEQVANSARSNQKAVEKESENKRDVSSKTQSK